MIDTTGDTVADVLGHSIAFQRIPAVPKEGAGCLQSDNELRKGIVESVRERGNVPAVNSILVRHNLNRTRFYRLFPGGVVELSKAAGVPVPKDRVEAVRKAVNKRGREHVSEESSLPRLTLNPNQAARVYGACQLEGGVEPSSMIDRLLDLDTTLREKRVTLSYVLSGARFVEMAASYGYTPEAFLTCVTILWNQSIFLLSRPCLDGLISLLKTTVENGSWSSMQEFVDYATKHHATIGYLRDYMEGKISLQQLIQTEGLQ